MQCLQQKSAMLVLGHPLLPNHRPSCDWVAGSVANMGANHCQWSQHCQSKFEPDTAQMLPEPVLRNGLLALLLQAPFLARAKALFSAGLGAANPDASVLGPGMFAQAHKFGNCIAVVGEGIGHASTLPDYSAVVMSKERSSDDWH